MSLYHVFTKKLFKLFTLYSLSLYLSSFVNFLLVPFVAYHLTATEFGQFDHILVFITLLAKSMMIGQDIQILKYSSSDAKHLWNNSIWISSGVALCIFIIVLVDLCTFHSISHFLEIEFHILLFAIVVAWSYAIFQLHSSIFKSQEDAKNHLFLHAIRIFSDVFLVVLCMYFSYLSFYTRFYAYSISFGVTLLCTLLYIYKNRIFSVRIEKITFHKTALLFMGIAFCELGIQFVDRMMIGKLLGFSDLGVYAFAYRFATVLLIINQVFHTIWMRFYLDTTYNKQFFLLALLLFFLIGGFYILCIYMFFPFVAPFEYIGGFSIFLIICFSYVFDLIWRLSSWPLLCNDREKSVFFIYLCSFILNILFNFWWLPIFGVSGAAYATLCSMVFGALFSSWSLYRLKLQA